MIETAKTKSINRNSSFDVLKILCTFLIVFHHYEQNIGDFDFPIQFRGGKFYFGYLVELFFIISGFLMYSYENKIQHDELPFKNYYLKRVIRLVPMSALSVLGFLIVTYIYHIVFGEYYINLQPSLMGLLLSTGGFHSWRLLPNLQNNSPIWYVGVLLFCYFLFYAFNKYCSKKISVIWTYIGSVFVGMIILTNEMNFGFLNSDIARGLVGFFTGLMLAHLMEDKKLDNWKTFIFSTIIFLGVLVGFLVGKYIIILPGYLSYDVATLDFVVFPSLIIMLNFKPIKNVFGIASSPLSFLASVSFEMYLWHTPMIILWKILHNQFFQIINIQCAKIMLFFSILLLVWSIIFYLFVEKKIVKSLSKRV